MRRDSNRKDVVVKPRRVADRTYRVADVYSPHHVDKVLSLDDVTGVYVNVEALDARGVADLGWVNELKECRFLTVAGAIKRNSLDSETLSRLEVLEWFRRSSFGFAFSQAPRLRSLGAPSDDQVVVDAALTELQTLAVSNFSAQDMALIDKLPDLRSLKLRGRGQVVTPGWQRGAPEIEVIMLEKLYLSSLTGFSKLRNLRRFQAHFTRLPAERTELDLREFSRSLSLEWLEIAPLGFLTHVDSILALPHLRGFYAYEGWYCPDVLPTDGPARRVPAPQ